MKYLLSAAALLLSTLSAQAADLPPGAEKAETCFACHGPGGISQMAETPSLAGQPDGFLQWQLVYFRSGTRKSPIMQPMAATLTDTDIRGLAKYFASQKPAPADTSAPVEAAMFAVGQKIAQQNRCASCHKDDFSGVQATPRIANQREDYLLKSLRDFKSGARTGGGVAAMADVVYPLGDDELRGLAYFMGHFGAPAANLSGTATQSRISMARFTLSAAKVQAAPDSR